MYVSTSEVYVYLMGKCTLICKLYWSACLWCLYSPPLLSYIVLLPQFLYVTARDCPSPVDVSNGRCNTHKMESPLFGGQRNHRRNMSAQDKVRGWWYYQLNILQPNLPWNNLPNIDIRARNILQDNRSKNSNADR
jgi:hypothetical protein